jgi:hypothetical protein
VRLIKAMALPVDGWFVTQLSTATAPGSGDVSPGATTPAARTLVGAGTTAGLRSVRRGPERCEELRHMSLERLRNYRRTLLSEELSASYWRRLLQARRDLLRSNAALGDRTALRDALTEARGTGGRQAILALHPASGMPILPHLPDLWASEVAPAGTPEARELTTRLTSAESVLSSYREALHRRLDRATADLVARYHEDPRSCFAALPFQK